MGTIFGLGTHLHPNVEHGIGTPTIYRTTGGYLSHYLFPWSSRRRPAAIGRLLLLSSVPSPSLVTSANTGQVSKQFYDLTYDHAIWKTLYTNARLPRPPGPFPSQTIQFLERTLVQSERLAHSWTTQPMGAISSIESGYTHFPVPPKIIYGKWLVSCESSSKFVVHDLDSKAGPHSYQFLWESASLIYSWDACPVVSTSGLFIHVVFCTIIDELLSWSVSSFTCGVHAFHVCL
jgi:hypothetical protein